MTTAALASESPDPMAATTAASVAAAAAEQRDLLLSHSHPALDVSYVRSQIWTPRCADIARRRRSEAFEVATAHPHPLYSRRPDLLRKRQRESLTPRDIWVREWLESRFDRPRMRAPELANRPKSELPACSPGRVLHRLQVPQTRIRRGTVCVCEDAVDGELLDSARYRGNRTLSVASISDSNKFGMAEESNGRLADSSSRLALQSWQSFDQLNGSVTKRSEDLRLHKNSRSTSLAGSMLKIPELPTSQLIQQKSASAYAVRQSQSSIRSSQISDAQDVRQPSNGKRVSQVKAIEISSTSRPDSQPNSDEDLSTDGNLLQSLTARSKREVSFASELTFVSFAVSEPDENTENIGKQISNFDSSTGAVTDQADHEIGNFLAESSFIEEVEQDDVEQSPEPGEVKPQLIIQSYPLKPTESGEGRDSEDTKEAAVGIAESRPSISIMWRNRRRRSTIKRSEDQPWAPPAQETPGARRKSLALLYPGSSQEMARRSSTAILSATPEVMEHGSDAEVTAIENREATRSAPGLIRVHLTACKPVHADRSNSLVAVARSKSYATIDAANAGLKNQAVTSQESSISIPIGEYDYPEGDHLGEYDLDTRRRSISLSEEGLHVLSEEDDERGHLGYPKDGPALPRRNSEDIVGVQPVLSHHLAIKALSHNSTWGFSQHPEQSRDRDRPQQGLTVAGSGAAAVVHLQQQQQQQQQQPAPVILLVRRRKRNTQGGSKQQQLLNPVPQADHHLVQQSDSEAREDIVSAVGTTEEADYARITDEVSATSLLESNILPTTPVKPRFTKKQATSLNWFQMDSTGGLATDKNRRRGVAKAAGGNSKAANGPLTTRFELPFDLKDLEAMEPKDYIKQYSVISSRRLYLYQKLYQKYRNPSINAIETKDLERCIADLLVGGLTRERLDKLKELCGLTEVSQLDSRMFYAFCAVVERLTTGKSEQGLERDGCLRQRLESADFTGLQFKLQGVSLSEGMQRLLDAL